MPLFASHHDGSLFPLHNNTLRYYLPPSLPLCNTLLPNGLGVVKNKRKELDTAQDDMIYP